MREKSLFVLKLAAIYAVAALVGYLASLISIPLPWMIGPVIISATLTLTGIVKITIPTGTRPFGQAVVACQVGHYFTPLAFASLIASAPKMLLLAVLIVLGSFTVALVLSRLGGIGLTNAVIATIPTSPIEAAVIAEKYGFDIGPVILSQTLRVVAVVVVIPLVIFAIGGRAEGAGTGTYIGFDLWPNLLLALICYLGMVLFQRLRISNPYFLGPLFVTAVLTAAGFVLSPVPTMVLCLGQIVLGTWLGSMMRRSTFARAGKMMGAAVFTTFLFIFGAAGLAVLTAYVFELQWELMALAAAPGGLTEMALTASYIGTNVALVTAFHITRLFLVIPNVPWIIRLSMKLEQGHARR